MSEPILHIDESAYHADPSDIPSLSSSIARKLIDASPLHAWWAHPKLNPEWTPDPGTRGTALGSVCHRLVLGDGPEVVVIDADAYRSKAANEERDEAIASGRTPILAHDYERAEKIAEAARDQLPPDLLGEGGEAEVSVLAEDSSGAWLRCRIDWWSADRLTLVDYKTTQGSASPAAFVGQVARMGYDFQDAFYQRTVAAALPELAGRLRFVFVAQEIAPPFALSALEISESDRTVTGRKVEAAIGLWNECLASSRWPGYGRNVHRVELPPWHHQRWLEAEAEMEVA